jgi:hypothetical protein
MSKSQDLIFQKMENPEQKASFFLNVDFYSRFLLKFSFLDILVSKSQGFEKKRGKKVQKR